MYHHTGYDKSLNPLKLNVGFGTFTTLLETWEKNLSSKSRGPVSESASVGLIMLQQLHLADGGI